MCHFSLAFIVEGCFSYIGHLLIRKEFTSGDELDKVGGLFEGQEWGC